MRKTFDAKVVHDEDSLQYLVKKFTKGCVVDDNIHFDVGEDVKPLG